MGFNRQSPPPVHRSGWSYEVVTITSDNPASLGEALARLRCPAKPLCVHMRTLDDDRWEAQYVVWGPGDEHPPAVRIGWRTPEDIG